MLSTNQDTSFSLFSRSPLIIHDRSSTYIACCEPDGRLKDAKATRKHEMAQMGVVHAPNRFGVEENRSTSSLALAQRDDNASADCLTASLA